MNVKWHKRFISLAREISTWSKDPSTQVGAVIVNPVDKIIISTGYNGFPAKISDDISRLENREVKYEYTIHAEVNSILNAAKIGASTRDCFIYVYGLPVCKACALNVIQSGISEVYWDMNSQEVPERWIESINASSKLFEEAGVIFERIYNDNKNCNSNT